METKFSRRAAQALLTNRQKSVIIGSVLGDGYLTKTTRGYALRINHSIKQKEYVDWKYDILKNIVNGKPAWYKNKSYYFRTVTHDYFSVLHKLFYHNNAKKVPERFLGDGIDIICLAVWIMDDGSRDGKQLRLNTQSFSRKDNEILSHILCAKLRIKTTLNKDKDRFRLRVMQESIELLRKQMSGLIIPSMHYKLFP